MHHVIDRDHIGEPVEVLQKIGIVVCRVKNVKISLQESPPALPAVEETEKGGFADKPFLWEKGMHVPEPGTRQVTVIRVPEGQFDGNAGIVGETAQQLTKVPGYPPIDLGRENLVIVQDLHGDPELRQ